MQDKIKNYTRIAIASALTFVLGGVLVPLMQFLPHPALRGVMLTPLYSCVLYVLLKTTKSRFTCTMYGALLGALISVFLPYMFLVNLILGIVADVLRWIGSRDGVASAVFSVLQFPFVYFIITGRIPVLIVELIILYVGSAVNYALAVLGIYVGYRIKRRVLSNVDSRGS